MSGFPRTVRLVAGACVIAVAFTSVLMGRAFADHGGPHFRFGAPPEPAGPQAEESPAAIISVREGVYIRVRNGRMVAVSEPRIQSRDQLDSYRDGQLRLLSDLSGSDVSAMVTFRRPLEREHVRLALSNVQPGTLIYKSHPQGTGSVPFELSPQHAAELVSFEKRQAEAARRLNGVSDFRLIDGYIAARVTGTAAGLRQLMTSPVVFLVDIGPVDVLGRYPDARLASVNHLYYPMEEYGG